MSVSLLGDLGSVAGDVLHDGADLGDHVVPEGTLDRSGHHLSDNGLHGTTGLRHRHLLSLQTEIHIVNTSILNV